MSRRWRYPRSRRGDFFDIVPPGPAPAATPFLPAFQEPSGRNARLAGTRTSRGRFLPVIPAVCPPPARLARRAGARPGVLRRGDFYLVPFATPTPPTPWIPPVLDARRSPARTARRGRFFPVSLTSSSPATVVWIPAAVDTRRPPARPARRGRFFAVPPAGFSLAAPIVLPLRTPDRSRLLSVRRGRIWSPPPPVQQPAAPTWVPVFVRRARQRIGPVRRGEYVPLPPPSTVCPRRIGPRRPLPVLRRRSHGWGLPWVQQNAPAASPVRVLSRRAAPRPTRRGAFIDPPWVGAAFVPYVAPDEVEATPRSYVSEGTARTVEPAATARTSLSTATARSPR